MTIVFGIFAWFFIPDFPDQNNFLTQEQTAFVLSRVERDRGDSVPDTLSRAKVIKHLLDWRAWAFGGILSLYQSAGRNSPIKLPNQLSCTCVQRCLPMQSGEHFLINAGFVLTSSQVLRNDHPPRDGLEYHKLVTFGGFLPFGL